jgi:crotonobetainyl-CoA:carnitine CoA-transferase CaiB-like acyl-CoA transferase
MEQSLHTHFFKDMVVLELASVLAGPSVGRFFAECGARVIKVEHPDGGDVTRSWKVPGEAGEISAYYASVNAGKEVIRLNLKDASALEKIHELLQKSTVVLSNFRDESARKFGLSPDELRNAYPHLIIGQIDAFSPESTRPAYDIVLQAEAGYVSMCGSKNEPARLPVAFIDILAGHQLKEGILMALLHQSRGNSGCIVRVNLLDVAIGSLMNQASNYLMANYLAEPMGTLHPNIAPYGECFGCADRKPLIVAIGNDAQFKKMLELLEMSELQKDVRFSNNAERVKHRSELWNLMAPGFARKNRSEWLNLCEKQQIPVGALLNLQEVFEGAGKQLITQSQIEGFTVRSVQTVNLQMH